MAEKKKEKEKVEKEESESKKKKRTTYNGDVEETKKVKMVVAAVASPAKTKKKKKGPSPTEVNPHEEAGKFSNFNLSIAVTEKLTSRGITYLFPVQYKTREKFLSGNNIIVKAGTGSGKTLAYAIPLVEKLQAFVNPSHGRAPRALILAPTEKLVEQIGDNFRSISTTICTVCFSGGSTYGPQLEQIRRGIDVLVGTPARILGHLTKTKNVLDLSILEYVVLAEADCMLNMGFADHNEKIFDSVFNDSRRKSGKKPQTLLFSATIPSWVKNIANKYLESSSLEELDLVGGAGGGGDQTSKTVDHLAVRCVPAARAGMIDLLLRKYGGVAGRKEARAIVFCQTTAECLELATSSLLSFPCQMLTGNVPQAVRDWLMSGLRDGRFQCLVATDVAVRGLDVPEVDMVIQCAPPGNIDSYIHWSGQINLAGRGGVCICLYGPHEESKLKQVERAANISFTPTPAPKAKELMELKKDELMEKLMEIGPASRDVFLDSADALIASDGARESLASALSALSGIRTSQRSLLSGAEETTTIMITNRIGFRSKDFPEVVLRILERRLGPEMKKKVTNVSLIQNGAAALFDIPTADKDKVLVDFGSDSWEWTEELTEIPALKEPLFDGRSV